MSHIIGIGTDLIEVQRVKEACKKETFLQKCFTGQEIELIRLREKRVATGFAGKEAVAKAFGTGFGEISLKEIEILRDELGAPIVVLGGKAQKKAEELGIKKIHISLSDTKEMATAYVVAEGE